MKGGEKPTEEAREKKRKLGESDDDQVMKKAKSSSSGQVSVDETMTLQRKMDREEKEEKDGTRV